MSGEELLDHGAAPPPAPTPRRRASSTTWVIGVVLAGLALGIVAFYLSSRSAPPVETTPASDTPASGLTSGETEKPTPRLDLPPLEESDETIRNLATRLSDHPQLVRWLTPEDIVQRAVVVIDNVARGDSPTPHLDFLRPEGTYTTDVTGTGHHVPNTANFQRYDLAAEVFGSLDTGATVRLYYDLEPLLDEAYAELGDPSRTFRQTLALALDRLLAIEVADTPPVVEPQVSSYRYADPQLEALSEAEKLLLRLGPENAQKVQTKLRFLRAALDLPEGDATSRESPSSE